MLVFGQKANNLNIESEDIRINEENVSQMVDCAPTPITIPFPVPGPRKYPPRPKKLTPFKPIPAPRPKKIIQQQEDLPFAIVDFKRVKENTEDDNQITMTDLLSETEGREKQVSFLKNLDLIKVLSELSEIDIGDNTCKEIEDNAVKGNEVMDITVVDSVKKHRRTEVVMEQLDTFLTNYTIPPLKSRPCLSEEFIGDLLSDYQDADALISTFVDSRHTGAKKHNNGYADKVVNLSAIILAELLCIIR